MRWEKLGRVYAPDGSVTWMKSHAYLPTPYALDEDTIRVYVAFLDDERVGRVGLVDVAAEDPRRVLRVSERPVLDVGTEGAFDEHGVTPSSVVTEGDTIRLYYFGWQRARDARYLLFAGVAASTDGGETFKRMSSSPVLPPVEGERVCRSAPAVLREEHAWRTWYVAGDAWTEVAGRLVPTYEIRTATSPDGIRWGGRGTTAVALRGEDEFGLGRPFVCPTDHGYELWYSLRTRADTYRIGFATSPDGVSWRRRDAEAGIDVSSVGWDSEMICFGSVVATRHGTYLFYNGNAYGSTGFGVARREPALR